MIADTQGFLISTYDSEDTWGIGNYDNHIWLFGEG